MALTLSGTNGVVGAGFTLDPSGASVTAGVGTFSSARVGAAVTISESGIEASGIGITCANINGQQIGGRRNLIINGAMAVAQRGTSYTGTDTYATVDRFRMGFGGTDENPTQSQVDVASGTTPYTLGFRKAYRITNGNQTGGLGAGDSLRVDTLLEAQDFANSGWNYTSASSYITLSYWVKSSVAQEFFGYLYTADSPNYKYGWSLGSLSADTWTKVIKTIPGNSNLVFNNDTGIGCWLNLLGIWGTNSTSSDATPNTWMTWDGAKRSTDQATTWYDTDNATFEITGVQLEVGPQATAFEHRSHGEELALCRRYYYRHAEGAVDRMVGSGCVYNSSINIGYVQFPCQMRAAPSMHAPSGTNYYKVVSNNSTQYQPNCTLEDTNNNCSGFRFSGGTSTTTGHGAYFRLGDASAYVAFTAEL